jgi:hypothetical protein
LRIWLPKEPGFDKVKLPNLRWIIFGNGELHIEVKDQKWGGNRTVPVSCLSDRELQELKDLSIDYLIGDELGEWEVDKAMEVIGGIHDYRHDFARERFDQLI